MAIYGTLGGQDSTSTGYPSIRPTLDLNFAATKILDTRVTFYRDSLATYTDSQGIVRTVPANVPRFDHDPTTGESLGLLIEESRTNLFPNSQSFVGNWTLTNCTLTANSIASPSQNVDATTSTMTASGSTGVEYNSLTFSNLANYTISIFVKRKTGTGNFTNRSRGVGTSRISATFSLENQTATIANQATSASIISYPNGWFRCTVSGPVSSDEYGVIFLNSATSGDEFYIWGAQIEAGSFASSYIPTSGSTVTRNADLPYISGTNFTNFYNSSEGTFSINATRYTGTNFFFSLFGTNTLYFDTVLTSTSVNSRIGVSVPDLTYSTTSTGVRVSTSYNSTTHSLSVNGSTATDATHSGGIPNNNILYIGRGNGNSTSFVYNGTISRFMYYNKKLTNTQLQNLTAL